MLGVCIPHAGPTAGETHMVKTIGNPLSWTAQAVGLGSQHIGEGARELGGVDERPIETQRITAEDLRSALSAGYADFLAMRTDVMFIVVVYPIIGVLLTWAALDRDFLPMLFPLVAGFALIGPAAGIGLYEMSRKRESGERAGWGDAFQVVTSRSIAPILALVGYLGAIFAVWLMAANLIYAVTLGPEPPQSITGFVGDVFTTGPGWAMLVLGCGVGGLFAVGVLAISLVSFPLLIDRHVGLPRAVATSVRVTLENPVTVVAWGAVVVALLLVGMVTAFVGLVIVLPVLGHATWHLYRRAVKPAA